MSRATLASELLISYTTGGTISSLPSSSDPGFDLDAAYMVEAEFRRLRMAEGRTVTGRKVGYANKAMWRALKLETLVWASMYDDTIHQETSLDLSRFISPRIEPEIVFKLKQSIRSSDLDAAGALECVDWLAIGFEIIECPFPGWQFKPADFVAAFGLHRALVVGKPCEVVPHSIPALVDALAGFKLKLLKNGALVEEGAGRNSLRSPALCLAELARAVLRQPGAMPLEAGELISTGTLTGAQPIASGDVWEIEMEGLALVDLRLTVL